MIKRITLIITIIFFAGMLILTLSARHIHNAFLPKVETGRAQQAPFPFEYIDESGAVQTGTQMKLSVTGEQLDNGIYVIYSAVKNGEKRNFVRLADIAVGSEYNGFFEVISGLNSSDRIVISSDGELYDGAEVLY